MKRYSVTYSTLLRILSKCDLVQNLRDKLYFERKLTKILDNYLKATISSTRESKLKIVLSSFLVKRILKRFKKENILLYDDCFNESFFTQL